MMKRFTARELPYVEAAREALLAGFEAFMIRQPISANPHDPTKSHPAYAAWRAGWLEAEAALESADRLNRVA